MSRRVFSAVLVAAAVVLAACSPAAEPVPGVDSLPEVQWLPCGSIECAQVDVPVDYAVPNGPTVALSMFRRVATGVEKPKTVVVLPDRRYGRLDIPSYMQL